MTKRKVRQKARRQTIDDRGQTTGPRIVAVGKIVNGIREIRITFQSMSPLGQAAVRRVFGEDTARAEEIVNA